MNKEELQKIGLRTYIEQNVIDLGNTRDEKGYPIYSTETEGKQVEQILGIATEYSNTQNALLLEEIKELKDKLQYLNLLIGSKSVYTLLRFGDKSPSKSGVDECEDDHYLELYNICNQLRK